MLSLLLYHGLDGTHQGVSWVDYRMVTIEGVRSCTLSLILLLVVSERVSMVRRYGKIGFIKFS